MLDIAILKQKLSAFPVETDPNAITEGYVRKMVDTQSADTVSDSPSTVDGPPDGYVRKTIMTPHGEMNVLVPSNSDKAKNETPDGVTSLQSLINGAVSIDIDERGEVVSYVDPSESKFKPGTGQVKRQPAKLTTGQRRRLDNGQGIITDPISVEQSPATIADFESARTEAVVRTIESGQPTIMKSLKTVETQASEAVAAVSELGKGSCCHDGLLKQPAKTIEREFGDGDDGTDVTQEQLDFEELQYVMNVFGFTAKDVINKIKEDVSNRPGDFWDKTLNYIRK